MAHGANTNSAPVEAPVLFDRVARKMNVDYAFYKTKEGKYLLFFKSGQADAISACFSEYSHLVLRRGKSRKPPILEQLINAQEQVRQQPHRELERVKEAAREDR